MGHLYFSLLSHVSLAHEVAGVAPLPSPSTGEDMRGALGNFHL